MILQNKNHFCPNYRSKITSCIFCTNFAPFPKTSHSKTIPQSFVFCLCAWSHKDMILVAEFYTSFSGHIISISYTLSLKLVFRRTMKSFGIKQHFKDKSPPILKSNDFKIGGLLSFFILCL